MSRRSGAVAPRGERGTRVPQQARSRRTRERILTAATTCFDELGYDDLTIDEVIRLNNHGIAPPFVRARVDAGYTDLTVDELVEIKSRGTADVLIRKKAA